MIHTFKLNGVKAAVDSRDGSVAVLDNLSWQMLAEIPRENPETMPAEMPTALRYALAKYDSRDLAEAYKCLFSLFTAEKESFVPAAPASMTCVVGENGAVRQVLPPLCPVVCFVVKGEVTEDALAGIRTLAEEVRGTVKKLCLTAPLDPAVKLAPLFDEVMATVAVKELADAVLPENLGIDLLFAPEDNLSGAVTSLFAKGVSVVSATPVEDTADTALQLEKLSRELLRYRKKGGPGVFAPFVLNYYGTNGTGNHLFCPLEGEPRPASPTMAGEFSEFYGNSGALAHLTDRLTRPETVNLCVECAICLSAE